MRSTLRAEYDHSLRRHAHQTAVECDGRTLTYAEIDRWSRAVAHQLRSTGVGAGSVVALYLHNCAEFVVADVAIARLGAVKLPVNYMLSTSTVAYELRAAGTSVVITDVGLAESAAQACADLPHIARLEVATGCTTAPPGVRSLAGQPLPTDELPALPDLQIGPEAPAALYFTGGTTGRPKGARHSQASTVALHHTQMLEAEIGPEERLLLMTPLAHAAGLFAESALIRGATSVITDGFDAARAVELMRTQRITWTFLVPTMIYRILDVLTQRPHDREASSALRTIVYGAAPIAPARLEQALDILGPVFVQLYGQTESPNWGTRLAKSDHDLCRPSLLGSCGRASIAADVAVIDDDGTPIEDGEVGEVWLRTPYLLTEYVGDPDATAAKFINGGIRTGDIGVLDNDGYLYLRDRKSDMVISGGMNVYCREVEDVLSRHPSVIAVAVIGIPHDDWGEAVHAVVVATQSFDDDEFVAWSRDRLAAYARPKSVETVTALPETPLGKIDKKALRERYWSGRSRSIG